MIRRNRTRNLEHEIVWIMGSARTGSTWLLYQLGKLLEASVIDEPLIGAHLGAPMSVITGQPLYGSLDARISDVTASRPDYFFSETHASTWKPALRDLVLRRFAAAIPRNATNCTVLVKEPTGALGALMLLQCLPGSRLLFLVRDGRDVVDSVLDGLDGGWITEVSGLDVDHYGGRRELLTRRAEQWVRDVSAVRQAYAAHDPGLRLIIRYEDLRMRPIEEITRVLEWLGRPLDRGRVELVVDEFSRDRVDPLEQGPGKFLRAATPGLWRDHFDAEETVLIQRIMGPLLEELGYE